MRIRFALAFALVAVCAIAATAQGQSGPNQLTAAEQKEGWRLLFDGKTLNGWRGFHNDKTPAGWTVDATGITKTQAKGELGQAGGDLITADQFDNFEFAIEWKLSKGGNSGIKYLVSESLPAKGKSAISFEYQVLDDENHPDAKAGIAGNRTAGSLYDLIPAVAGKKLNPPGQWNQTRIIVRGNYVEHWLNGVKTVEFERGGQMLKDRIAQSKFKDTQGFGTFAKGHILLQDHGDAVWYRNIKIRAVK